MRIYYRDHPPPHFDADYGEHEITVDIDSGIVQGRFPRQALMAVLDWYTLHQDELARSWQLVQTRLPLNPIDPLKSIYVRPCHRGSVHRGAPRSRIV